jgi:DNA-binding transcriptional MerR regulator
VAERVWTLPEIARAAGVEYRTIHNWRRRGLISPSVRSVNGSGNTELYSDDDLIHVMLLGALRPFLTMDGLALVAEGAGG